MKRLVFSVVIVASVLLLAVLVDTRTLTRALVSLPTVTVLSLLAVLFANEILKGLRWAFYLRAAKLEIRVIHGLTSYLAAQAATAIPGGSVLSARLVEEHARGRLRMRQAAPGLVVQMIGDMFAVASLAAVAIVALGQRSIQLLVPGLAILAALGAVAVFRSERSARWLLRAMSRRRLTRRFLPVEEDFRLHLRRMLRVGVLTGGTLFSFGTTLLSVTILFILVNGLTSRGLAVVEGIYVHSFSMLAHLFVPTPGGLGASDVSLAGMLNYIGIGLGRATFIALTYRSVGMVFRTGIGLVTLLALYPSVLVEVRAGERPVPSPSVSPGRAILGATGIAAMSELPPPAIDGLAPSGED
jgi:uncharacterized membrane protein YbhN (UPF0104 family)